MVNFGGAAPCERMQQKSQFSLAILLFLYRWTGHSTRATVRRTREITAAGHIGSEKSEEARRCGMVEPN
ncbi:hypothetical protein TWF718_001642 [Orbilia javanica]|uniref:Uncharacterized protein n=1 Tax=Orbilia javanica TaxID=47235 RepID=A0AAN8RHC9_9PEZI